MVQMALESLSAKHVVERDEERKASMVRNLGLVLNRSIQREHQRDRTLGGEGVDANATITRVWRDSDKEGTHMVSYRFLADGREITGRSKMYRDDWSTLSSGDPLPIRYLPSD